MYPEHWLPVGTATEDVATIKTQPSPRDGARQDLVGRVGGPGGRIAEQAARRTGARYHGPHVQVGQAALVGAVPLAPRRRTVSVIASGATHATHTLTEVRVRRRSTGPATMPGSESSGMAVESSGTSLPTRHPTVTRPPAGVKEPGDAPATRSYRASRRHRHVASGACAPSTLTARRVRCRMDGPRICHET